MVREFGHNELGRKERIDLINSISNANHLPRTEDNKVKIKFNFHAWTRSNISSKLDNQPTRIYVQNPKKWF